MRRVVPLVAGLVVAAGCSSPSPARTADAAASSPPATSTASTTPPSTAATTTSGGATSPGSTTPSDPSSGPSAPATPSGRADTITLAFAGDVHFARRLERLLHDSDAEWATRMPELAAADFAMVNLETAITTRGTAEAKTYTFRASPRAFEVLKAAGVDAVSMANNHAADFGRVGIVDTLAAIRTSPVPVVGFGKDADAAYAPLTVDVSGVKVGVIAATEIVEETYVRHSAGPGKAGVAQNVERERFTRAAKEAVATHDLVVAYLHWGVEGTTCPSRRQRRTAEVLREAGVDVIVGTHAHRPQGSGWSGRAFVGYGTGNHVWYNTSPGSRSSGVLTLTVDAARVRGRGGARDGGPAVTAYTWTPKVITSSGVPMPPTSSKAALEQAAAAARRCSDLAQSPS